MHLKIIIIFPILDFSKQNFQIGVIQYSDDDINNKTKIIEYGVKSKRLSN